MCAMPTANVGAPPARLYIVCSPRFCARIDISSSLTGNPAAETFCTTSVGVPLVFIAKYSPGWSTQGRDQRHRRDHHLSDHRAVADISNARFAFKHLRRGV